MPPPQATGAAPKPDDRAAGPAKFTLYMVTASKGHQTCMVITWPESADKSAQTVLTTHSTNLTVARGQKRHARLQQPLLPPAFEERSTQALPARGPTGHNTRLASQGKTTTLAVDKKGNTYPVFQRHRNLLHTNHQKVTRDNFGPQAQYKLDGV